MRDRNVGSAIKGAPLPVEQGYRKLLESAPDAMVIVNSQGLIVLVNSQTEKLFGYSEEELFEQPVEILMPDRFRRTHREHRTDFFHDPHVRQMGVGLDLFGLRKDGQEFPVDISLSPLKTEEGVFVVSAIRDITDQKKIEEELRRARDELELRVQERTAELLQANVALEKERNFVSSVLDTTGALVVVLDAEGRIVRFNRSCERTTGYAADEVRGQYIWDLFILPEEMDLVKSVFRQLRAGQFPNQARNYWRTRDGNRRLIAWSNTALVSEEGRVEYIIGTGIDLTEQHALEQQVIRAEELALIGELAAGLAHEVKNPLAGIKGAIEIVMEGLPEGDPNRPVLQQVLDETMRVNSTVSQLLDYARPHKPNPAPIDLNELIERVIASARLQLDTGGIALEFHPARSLPVVVADPEDMQKVILNLLLNAIYAVKKKGRVVTRTDIEAEGAFVKVSVADTGAGIPRENLEKIFRPFFTTKKRGTGLGLANCQRIVASYGGTIAVESEPGKGSTFTITLPTRPVA